MKILILTSLFLFLSSIIFSERMNNNYTEYFLLAKNKIDEYKPKRKDMVIIIDFRKDVFSNRLYVLDMNLEKVVLQSRVTHALKSGIFYPNSFSNIPNSKKSSIGTLITQNSRQGKYGYSMVIKGLDKGINDNVKKRFIIFHPTKTFWSQGCFATPKNINDQIIDLTKNGCLIYVIS